MLNLSSVLRNIFVWLKVLPLKTQHLILPFFCLETCSFIYPSGCIIIIVCHITSALKQQKYNEETWAWCNFSFQTSLLIPCGLKPAMKANSYAKEGLPITYRTEVQKAKSLQACKNTLIKGAVHRHSHSAKTTWVFPWLMISLKECKPHYTQGLAVYQAKYIGNWASWAAELRTFIC